MITDTRNGIELLAFESLAKFPNIIHGITTRGGVIERDNYSSFNISPYCGDNDYRVASNKQLLCDRLAILPDKLILPYQTHEDNVLVIDEAFLQLTPVCRSEKLNGVDALITGESGCCVGVSTADCVPILLYDCHRKVVAAVHAGWRGTVKRIVEKCVHRMVERYDCRPADIIAGIGPSISVSRFEVGEEVALRFRDGFDMEKVAHIHPDTGKYHIDLWEANRQLLLSAGLLSSQIEISGVCTRSDTQRFFSARALGVKCGRIVSFIGFK